MMKYDDREDSPRCDKTWVQVPLFAPLDSSQKQWKSRLKWPLFSLQPGRALSAARGAGARTRASGRWPPALLLPPTPNVLTPVAPPS
eukprot:3806420-Prymnesium_polylepis.1